MWLRCCSVVYACLVLSVMSAKFVVSRAVRTVLLQNAKQQSAASSRTSSSTAMASINLDLAEGDKLGWRLCASTCLIRLPQLEPEKNRLEQSFEDFASKLEFEKSVLCDWELEKIRQSALIQGVESGKVDVSSLDFKFSNQEIEDGCEVSLAKFKESFEEIDIDDSDLKNPNRRPHESLVLITKQKLGKDYVWMLPLKPWTEGETLRETAQNALWQLTGNELQAKFISNAPASFYKYKIPKLARRSSHSSDHSQTDPCVGVKLFIYSAFMPRDSYSLSPSNNSGSALLRELDSADVVDYAWVAADEMRRYMKPKYVDALRSIML